MVGASASVLGAGIVSSATEAVLSFFLFFLFAQCFLKTEIDQKMSAAGGSARKPTDYYKVRDGWRRSQGYDEHACMLRLSTRTGTEDKDAS